MLSGSSILDLVSLIHVNASSKELTFDKWQWNVVVSSTEAGQWGHDHTVLELVVTNLERGKKVRHG